MLSLETAAMGNEPSETLRPCGYLAPSDGGKSTFLEDGSYGSGY